MLFRRRGIQAGRGGGAFKPGGWIINPEGGIQAREVGIAAGH